MSDGVNGSTGRQKSMNEFNSVLCPDPVCILPAVTLGRGLSFCF